MSHLGKLVSWPEVGSCAMTQKPELLACGPDVYLQCVHV